MKKILIVYATKEGQTYKIAEFISGELQARGFAVYVIDAKMIASQNHIEEYDGIIVGAPVHLGKYPKALRSWVQSKASVISKKPSAFFSVCLGILEKDNKETQVAVRKIATDFFVWSGWKPGLWTVFAGAVTYSKYNWLIRLVMKSKSKKGGGYTDTSRDYEYTNWDEVQKFAKQFGTSVSGISTEYKNEDYQVRLGVTNH